MYKLVEEINANAIQGQEWAKGSKQLRFWQLDQALGVVVRKGDDLWGVHLTQLDSDSRAPFDEVAAASVLQLLPKVYDGSRGYDAFHPQLHMSIWTLVPE